MAVMKLKHGDEVAFDDEDASLVLCLTWSVTSGRKYAVNRRVVNGKIITTFMHRLIAEPGKGLVVDHIDGNGLNNRRSNLRVCRQQQNLWNRKTAEQEGVYSEGKKWRAILVFNGRSEYLGVFDEAGKAQELRNWAAKKLRGEFAAGCAEDGKYSSIDFPPRVRKMLFR